MTKTPDEALVQAAREWAADCLWLDLEPEDFDEMPVTHLVRGIDQHYDGGWPAFVRAELLPTLSPGEWAGDPTCDEFLGSLDIEPDEARQDPSIPIDAPVDPDPPWRTFTAGLTPPEMIEDRLPLKYRMELTRTDMMALLATLGHDLGNDEAFSLRSSILASLNIEEV